MVIANIMRLPASIETSMAYIIYLVNDQMLQPSTCTITLCLLGIELTVILFIAWDRRGAGQIICLPETKETLTFE